MTMAKLAKCNGNPETCGFWYADKKIVDDPEVKMRPTCHAADIPEMIVYGAESFQCPYRSKEVNK